MAIVYTGKEIRIREGTYARVTAHDTGTVLHGFSSSGLYVTTHLSPDAARQLASELVEAAGQAEYAYDRRAA